LHSGYTASAQAGGHESPLLKKEEVAERARNHVRLCVKHEAFGNFGVVPFGARKDILQAIEVLHAGQARLN
jgi:hypothetical protein